ncbi:unnamed protein product [Mytilus coruscus]|uniref:G-protein coupled receptors family 1 profile domain-containing protein n=1 Tax=Mytilus coruscus TaxID=42192 RepID=A0A6J8EBA9_MYTCO|nr:unnamed protein product [Mytilus coruscus]
MSNFTDISNSGMADKGENTTTKNSMLQSPGFIEYFNYVFLPVVTIVGVTGNIFTIIVMRSTRFSKTTSSILLIALAISDTIFLIIQPFHKEFVTKLVGLDVRAFSDVLCKLYFITLKSSKMMSSWFVVGLCIERFVAVWFPLKAKLIVTKRAVILMISVIVIVIATFNGCWSYAYKITNGECHHGGYNHNSTQEVQLFGGMMLAGLSLYSMIPIPVLVILTTLIIWKLLIQMRDRRSMTAKSKDGIHIKITVMLIGINIAFILLVFPVSFFQLAAFQSKSHGHANQHIWLKILKKAAQGLEQVNYGINFFLYVLTSQQFRIVFLGLFEKITPRGTLSSSNKIGRKTTSTR